MGGDLIAAEVEPVPGQADAAARALQRLGFRVLHIGPTISVQAPEPLWRSTFNVEFRPRTMTRMEGVPGSEVTYQQAVADTLAIPTQLQSLVGDVLFQEPPQLY